MTTERFFYAWGYKTLEKAQDALETMFANGEVSLGEHPKIVSYNGKYAVELDGISV